MLRHQIQPQQRTITSMPKTVQGKVVGGAAEIATDTAVDVLGVSKDNPLVKIVVWGSKKAASNVSVQG